jgi:hypothetical protein
VQSFSEDNFPAFYWSMEAFDGTRYVFDYTQDRKDGTLGIYSSNAKFMQAIDGIKADKRKTRNFNYQTSNEESASLILAKLRAYLLNK